MRSIVSAALIIYASLSFKPLAATPAKFDISDVLKIRRVSNPRVSPDGARIVYEKREVNPQKDRSESSLWLMSADGTGDRLLLKGVNAACWSPDGARLAYVAPDEGGSAQVFVRRMDGTDATRQITHTKTWPGRIGWSPDGRLIAFAGWVESKDDWPINMPQPPAGAEWAEPPRVVERLHYRAGGGGYVDGGREHLFVVPSAGGAERQLTSGEWSVGGWWDELHDVTWSWTPDGRTIVFDANTAPDTDLIYEESYINAVYVSTGAVRKVIPARGEWSLPAVSPDGQWVAFVGFYAKTKSYHSQELYIARLDGSGVKKISADRDRDVQELFWAGEGSGVYFTAQDRGNQNVYFASLSGRVRQVTTGAQFIELGNTSAGDIAVGLRSSFDVPVDIVYIPLRRPEKMRQVTNVNRELLDGLRLSRPEEIWYASSGGAKIQGWIYRPPDFGPSRSTRSSSTSTAARESWAACNSARAFSSSPPAASSFSTRSRAAAPVTALISTTRLASTFRALTTTT